MEEFPKARIPKHPVLSLATFGRRGKVPSILEAGRSRHVSQGRMAIALALEHASIGPGDEVLVPAYHCVAMVEPVRHVGATPVFYRIGRDTSVDIGDLAARLSPASKAVVAVHYFGFPQRTLPALRALCDGRGLTLIEDCAHAFFGSQDGIPFGAMGDYAVASSWKFFPIPEGGYLVSARHPLPVFASRGRVWSIGIGSTTGR